MKFGEICLLAVSISLTSLASAQPDPANVSGATSYSDSMRVDGLRGILLEGNEARASAHLSLIQQMVTDIRRAGFEASVQRYAQGFGISEQEAAAMVTYISDVSEEYSGFLQEKSVENCVRYLRDLETTNSSVAVANMVDAQNLFNEAFVAYFLAVEDSLQASLPDQAFAEYSAVLDARQSNVRSTAILAEADREPVHYFNTLCARTLF